MLTLCLREVSVCEPVNLNLPKLLTLKDILARPDGFEPPTPRFVVWCSIQLSYGRVLRIAREVFPTEQIRRERAFSYRLQPPLASLPALLRGRGATSAAVTRGLDRGSIALRKRLF